MTTSAMPTKFKFLVALYALSTLVAGVEFYLERGVVKGIALAITVFILISLVRGNEAMRQLIMFFAAIGLVISGVALIMSGVATLVSPLGILAAALSLYGVLRNAFVVWCLRQQDVQRWMFERSMGGALTE